MSRFISFGYGRLRPLGTGEVYQKVVMGVTLETCATMCLAYTQNQFHCLSFDFIFDGPNHSTCHMSKYIAPNVYGLASSDRSVMHFEKKGKLQTVYFLKCPPPPTFSKASL